MSNEGVGSMEYLKIDRKSPEILAALAEAPIYQKFALVKARPAIPGEKIITKIGDTEETENTATEGQWLVENPEGEKYLISEEKFLSRYGSTEKEGIFQAKGFCRAINNPHGQPIEIMAEWGEAQRGDAECKLADICDEEGKLSGEPYIIDGKIFQKTYKAKNN